jgi:hypothetical protein
MKWIRKYNESKSEFDLDFAISKIKENFSEDKVIEMYDNEMLEWVDPDWEDDYESEYDWYIDHNNGEAQDVIINSMINWFKKEYNKSLDSNEYVELFDKIKEEYDTLSY